MMKVAIVLRSTEHQPVSTTIVSYMACVSGLVCGDVADVAADVAAVVAAVVVRVVAALVVVAVVVDVVAVVAAVVAAVALALVVVAAAVDAAVVVVVALALVVVSAAVVGGQNPHLLPVAADPTLKLALGSHRCLRVASHGNRSEPVCPKLTKCSRLG